MKKFIILLFMTITMCVTANAQSKMEWFKWTNMTTFTFGCDVGGSYKNVCCEPDYVVGWSLSCLGVYYDKGFTSPTGINSTNLGQWESNYGDYWHIGYTIPISKYFNVTPLFGRITTGHCIVNGDDWYVGYTDIVNRWQSVEEHILTDYGVVLTANLVMPFEYADILGLTISAKFTQHQSTFNIGMLFNIGKLVKNCVNISKY